MKIECGEGCLYRRRVERTKSRVRGITASSHRRVWMDEARRPPTLRFAAIAKWAGGGVMTLTVDTQGVLARLEPDKQAGFPTGEQCVWLEYVVSRWTGVNGAQLSTVLVGCPRRGPGSHGRLCCFATYSCQRPQRSLCEYAIHIQDGAAT